MEVTRTECGDVFYKNEDGKLHREDGPAIIQPNGTEMWLLNGELHREDGPAITTAEGTKVWWRNGKRHRIGGPAIEWAAGYREWYLNGKQLTEEEFNNRVVRTVTKHGTIEYRNKDRQLHREDGPAIEHPSGDKVWFLNGKLHREGAPAIEDSSGNKEWYIDDQLHREDGPAIEHADGRKEWYLESLKLTEEEFLKLTEPAPEKSEYEELVASLSSRQLALLENGPPSSEVAKAEKKLRNIV